MDGRPAQNHARPMAAKRKSKIMSAPTGAAATDKVVPNPKKKKGIPFLWQWRKHRGFTQEQLAGRLEPHVTQGMISQLENGTSDYTGDLLDRLADALSCDPVDLLIRDPTDPEGMWSVWDQAKPGQRLQIVEVAKTLLKTGTGE